MPVKRQGRYDDMRGDLARQLLPRLGTKSHKAFNVFAVMHHGTHEKQLSNVFAWLLDAEGSHRLDDLFTRIFVEEVNRGLRTGAPLPPDTYAISQEVNTSPPGEPMDIADIFMVGDQTAIVIENYYISDGHEHDYQQYLDFAGGAGKRAVVVLLCGSLDESLLTKGWEQAAVVTYPHLFERFMTALTDRPAYATTYPEQHWFIQQMFGHFVKGKPVDTDLIDFMAAMCDTGEALRFRGSAETEAERLGADLKIAAMEQYGQSRELLMRLKSRLKSSVAPALRAQLHAALGEAMFVEPSAGYQGIYQWTINLKPAYAPPQDGDYSDSGPGQLQIKFGPSAWYAITTDKDWHHAPENPDYGRLFLTWKRGIYQSEVSLREVLEGLAEDDTRLRDEALALVRPT